MIPFQQNRYGLLLGVTLALLICTQSASAAQTALDIEMEELAINIKARLKKDDIDEVAIGTFTARKRLAASAGLSIEKSLGERLAAQGVKLNENADYEVQGSYQDYLDPATGAVGVKVAARLIDDNGDPILEFSPRAIFGDESVPTLLGLTGSFTSTKDPKKRGEQTKTQVRKPKVHIQKFRIKPNPDSPYAIEIHVKKGNAYVAQPASEVKGRAFVPIQREEVFAILLVNESNHEAAVTIALDGLNLFAFSANTNYTHMFIPANSNTRIDGWHLSNKQIAEFVVRALPQNKNAAIKLKDRNELGTITVCFSVAWKDRNNPPPGELTRSGKNFIDLGEKKGANFVETSRYIGTVRTVISVRYQK